MDKMRQYDHGFAPVGPDIHGGGGVDEIISHRCYSYANVSDEEDGGTGGLVGMANAVDYEIDGEIYQLAASSTVWDLRGLSTLAGNGSARTAIRILLCVDSAGACTNATTGNIRGTPASDGSEANPRVPDDCTAIGWLDLTITTNRDSYDWDQELSSHGTYHNGLPRADLYEAM